MEEIIYLQLTISERESMTVMMGSVAAGQQAWRWTVTKSSHNHQEENSLQGIAWTLKPQACPQ